VLNGPVASPRRLRNHWLGRAMAIGMQKPRQRPFRKPCRLREPDSQRRRGQPRHLAERSRARENSQEDRPQVLGAPGHEEEAEEAHAGADCEHALNEVIPTGRESRGVSRQSRADDLCSWQRGRRTL
jgi:hypothetical protein